MKRLWNMTTCILRSWNFFLYPLLHHTPFFDAPTSAPLSASRAAVCVTGHTSNSVCRAPLCCPRISRANSNVILIWERRGRWHFFFHLFSFGIITAIAAISAIYTGVLLLLARGNNNGRQSGRFRIRCTAINLAHGMVALVEINYAA